MVEDLGTPIQMLDSAGVTITLNSTSSFFNTWSNPERVSVQEVGDTIEMTYLETSTIALAVYPPRPPERRVFKIVFSCQDGKWNKSERIYGEIIPAKSEGYEFK